MMKILVRRKKWRRTEMAMEMMRKRMAVIKMMMKSRKWMMMRRRKFISHYEDHQKVEKGHPGKDGRDEELEDCKYIK